ncbi:hypothetical protein HY256_11095 [Candidatus Sumerlaeota bacterium]|nr:hypothetical protein [Candidatus Sumerlaeota bacterium]
METLPEREGPEEGSESAKPEAGKKEPPVLPKPETLQPPAVEIPPASPPADTKP